MEFIEKEIREIEKALDSCENKNEYYEMYANLIAAKKFHKFLLQKYSNKFGNSK